MKSSSPMHEIRFRVGYHLFGPTYRGHRQSNPRYDRYHYPSQQTQQQHQQQRQVSTAVCKLTILEESPRDSSSRARVFRFLNSNTTTINPLRIRRFLIRRLQGLCRKYVGFPCSSRVTAPIHIGFNVQDPAIISAKPGHMRRTDNYGDRSRMVRKRSRSFDTTFNIAFSTVR